MTNFLLIAMGIVAIALTPRLIHTIALAIAGVLSLPRQRVYLLKGIDQIDAPPHLSREIRALYRNPSRVPTRKAAEYLVTIGAIVVEEIETL